MLNANFRSVKYTIVAAMVGLLAACGGGGETDVVETTEASDDGQVVERSRRDVVAAEQREKKRQKLRASTDPSFEFFRYRIDTSSDRPLACFVFSKALDPDVDYSTYIEFSPAFEPALKVEGRELCVGGLSFGTSHTANLLAGLPSAEKDVVLSLEESVPIDFSERPPYVGFQGAGIILPREDADGLPIETVNVDSVNITVSRVNDRALAFKTISAGSTSDQGRYYYSYGNDSAADVAEDIWSGTMDIDALQNAPVTTVFPMQDIVGELAPGAYFVTLEDGKELAEGAGPPASARRWIMLTDLALTAYAGEQGLDVTLRSLNDGAPLGETVVQLVAQNNALLAELKTNADGRVRFDGPITSGTGPMSPKLLMALGAKGDLAVLDLTRAPVDLSEHDVGGRRTPGLVDSYVYTERGIYRPGEVVEIIAMLRDRTGERISDRTGRLTIYRPNGLEADRIRFDNPESGAVHTSYELPAGATRGQWRADMRIDGTDEVAGSVSFSVEDFVPQRIKVELEPDDTNVLKLGDTANIAVDARFLYGAPGAGLTVKSSARIEPQPNAFRAFEGFEFGRHDATFQERIIDLPDQTTDGAGVAVVNVNPGQWGTRADRPLRVNAVVNVLEPGGRPVSESVRIPYNARDLYVGLKPNFGNRLVKDEVAVFEVAAVNAEGDGIASSLNWKVIEIDYHYDWYRQGERWRWRRSRTTRTVNEGVLNTPAGGTAEIRVDGLGWGSHELIVEGPQSASASDSFYVGWGGRVSEDGTEAPDRVQVMGPNEAPEIGDMAEIEITAPYEGRAQLVVATDRVLSVEDLAVNEEGTRVSIPVTEDWGEGAYILVTVYTERDPVIDAKPRRAVGVAHVPVNMEKRTFNVSIAAPEIARPRREQVIEVSIEDGPKEPVFLTLAAVDEGILSLTKYQSPNPSDYYFGKKALEVELYDDYGRLLDPNMGLPAEIRSGGDQLGGEGLSVVPIKTVSLFSGVEGIGRSGRAKIRFELPEFNGELRLMAVAWSKTGLGQAEQTMIVRDEAPSDLILPRFLAPGDEAFLTASIDNVELPGGAFSATINSDGPLSIADSKFTKTLQPGQRSDAPVRISSDNEGISRVRYTVAGPNAFAVDSNYFIETRSPYLPETRVLTAAMQPGESFNVSADLIDGYLPGTSTMTIGFSSVPLDPAALYASLARYPYGCTEQTTSRALPLLYAESLAELGNVGEREDPRLKVQQAVNTLLNRQGANGAFGLWKEGDRYASPWLGAYTTDFIYRAKEQGYVVPDTAMARAYGALRGVATGDRWRINGYQIEHPGYAFSDDTQEKMLRRSSAYALYVLARAGEADISRLRYVHDRELDKLESPLAKAQIGAGLALMGDRSRAVSAFEAAEEALGYQNEGDYYQTPLRDLSAILALATEAEMDELIGRLSERLGQDAPDPQQLTTQEKAFALVAVNALDQGTELKMKVEGLGRGMSNLRQYQLSDSQIKSGVTFEFDGRAPVFRTILTTGSPASVPPPLSANLDVSKAYYSLTGDRVNLDSVRQGDQLVVSIRVTPEEKRQNPVIIADLLPAGFEIETVLNRRDGELDGRQSGAFAFLGKLNQLQIAQAQDDRYVAAIDVYNNPVRLAYVVRAVTPGDFAIPGVVAEDMYRPQVSARSKAGRVTITATESTAGGSQ